MMFFIFALAASLYAAVPLPEGLFRHNINADISNAATIFKIKLTHKSELITKLEGEQTSATAQQVPVEGGDVAESEAPIYLRIVLEKSDHSYKMLQLISTDVKFSQVKQTKSFVTADLLKSLEAETNFGKKMFYANLIMFGFGDSGPIFKYLKQISTDLKTNDELLNREKLALLERYRDYLKDSKGADQNRLAQMGLENPIKPSSEEKREKVSILMKEPMYKATPGQVVLKKHFGKFAWNLAAQNVQGWFDNDSLSILSLDLVFPDGSHQWQFKSYRDFENEHQAPAAISLRANNIEYSFNLSSIDFLKNKVTQFSEKSQEYLTKYKSSEITIPDYLSMLILY